MNYTVEQIETVLAQKDFIDTAIVPLIHVNFSPEHVKTVAMEANFLQTVVAYVEQQFKGRVLLVPPITYLHNDVEEIVLQNWQHEIEKCGLKHTIFITSDHRWTLFKEHQMIWLPAIPLESMDISLKRKILEEQLKQIMPTFTKAWSLQQMSNL